MKNKNPTDYRFVTRDEVRFLQPMLDLERILPFDPKVWLASLKKGHEVCVHEGKILVLSN